MKKQLLVLLMLGAFVGQAQGAEVLFNGKVYSLNELQTILFDRQIKNGAEESEWMEIFQRWFPDREEFNDLRGYKKSEMVETKWAPPVKMDPGKLKKQIEDQKKLEGVQRLAREKEQSQREEEAVREQQRIAAEQAEKERIQREEEAARIAAAELERKLAEEEEARLAEELKREQQRRLEAARLAEELRMAQEEAVRVAEEAAVKLQRENEAIEAIAEQMRKYEEDDQKKRKTDAEEKEAIQRVLDTIAAKDYFKGLHMTCAVCPKSGVDQCLSFSEDKFGRLCMRFDGSDIKYPLNFKKTFELWRSRMFNDSSFREAKDVEFSPLFRLLYDCARGMFEDLEATQKFGKEIEDQRQLKENERYAQHYPGVVVPKLESWSDKYPLFLKELKELGYELKHLMDGGYYYPDSTSSTVARHFIENGTIYEKRIFFNKHQTFQYDSLIYTYMRALTEANLKRTPAGREALRLVAKQEAQEAQEQAQAALAQLQVGEDAEDAQIAALEAEDAAADAAAAEEIERMKREDAAAEAAAAEEIAALEAEDAAAEAAAAKEIAALKAEEEEEEEMARIAREDAAAAADQGQQGGAASAMLSERDGLVTRIYRDIVLAQNSQEIRVRESIPEMRKNLFGDVLKNQEALGLTQEGIKTILSQAEYDDITDEAGMRVAQEILSLALDAGMMPNLKEFLLSIGNKFNKKSKDFVTGVIAAGSTRSDFRPSPGVISEVEKMRAPKNSILGAIDAFWKKNDKKNVDSTALNSVAELIFKLETDRNALIHSTAGDSTPTASGVLQGFESESQDQDPNIVKTFLDDIYLYDAYVRDKSFQSQKLASDKKAKLVAFLKTGDNENTLSLMFSEDEVIKQALKDNNIVSGDQLHDETIPRLIQAIRTFLK